jgi:hypothetical protein
MKKILLFILPLFLILTSPAVAKNETGSQNTGSSQQINTSPSSTGSSVQNKNQVNTQNQGEDTQLQATTQEQENSGDGEGLQTRNQAAIQNMSIVAQKVQEMLQIRTTGGIGEQVRQIAQEQNQAQTQIQDQLNKIDTRKGVLKSLLGPDYGALGNLEKQLEQNQLRVQQLEQLQNQLSNQVDITAVKEAIQALIQENTSLQELINNEEQTRSLFGWLFKLFAQ